MGLSVRVRSGCVQVFPVLRALLHLSNTRVEVLDECASLSDSSRTRIQEGERPCPEGLGLCISPALLKSGIFCVIKLSSSRARCFDPCGPSQGQSLLPWPVVLHPCPLLPCPSWKSTVTPRSR